MTSSEKPKLKDVSITSLDEPATPPVAAAVWAPANENHRNKVVPQNSPHMATKCARMVCHLEFRSRSSWAPEYGRCWARRSGLPRVLCLWAEGGGNDRGILLVCGDLVDCNEFQGGRRAAVYGHVGTTPKVLMMSSRLRDGPDRSRGQGSICLSFPSFRRRGLLLGLAHRLVTFSLTIISFRSVIRPIGGDRVR